MKLIGIIKSAFKSVLSNKLRSALTILGLIIGIASVIILVGIGSGASESVTSEVKSLGTDVLTITIADEDSSFKFSELDEILELDNISKVAPYKSINKTITRDETSTSTASILGINDSYLDLMNAKISSGRTISIIDVENKSKVCILGSEIATTLFSLADPVGETVKINGDKFTVIAVLEEQGSSMGTNIDDLVLIPITSAVYLNEDTNIQNLYVQVENEDLINMTKNVLENYIRRTLSISSDYYSVSSQDSTLDTLESVNNTLSLLLGGIASISLVVGGIGVMNVMLVSVTERTREIGIRKSLGAKKRDILFQFLVEALVLSLLGGIIGVALGLGIGYLAENFGFTFTPSAFVTCLAFSASALIGIVFGIIPASKAANLNPIEALRT
jgi:putative ABC transport system permease protein